MKKKLKEPAVLWARQWGKKDKRGLLERMRTDATVITFPFEIPSKVDLKYIVEQTMKLRKLSEKQK